MDTLSLKPQWTSRCTTFVGGCSVSPCIPLRWKTTPCITALLCFEYRYARDHGFESESLISVFLLQSEVGGTPGEDASGYAQSHEAMPHANLWIDANQSYTPANALDLLKRVSDIREIYCMEQPVASQDWFGMKRVREDSPLPIAIDEGCFTYFDLAKIARLECADAVVLKSVSLWRFSRMPQNCSCRRSQRIRTPRQRFDRSRDWFIASVHLFSTLDLVLPAELNAPAFLETLAVSGVEIQDHVVTVPDGPGLGVTPDEDYIHEHLLKT